MPTDAATGLAPDEPHVLCTTLEGCPEGHECVQDPGATMSVCRRPCSLDIECGNGRTCAVLDRFSGRGYCSIPCDPLTAAGCPSGEGCDLIERQTPTLPDGGDRYARFYDCRRAEPTGTAGVVCDPGDPIGCASGFTCYFLGAGPACERWCRATTGAAQSPDCPPAHRCDPATVAPDIAGTPLGVCTPF
jgi:hypothetical protein